MSSDEWMKGGAGWAAALALSASALLVHCGDRYQSCTETRTCAGPEPDAAPGGSAGTSGSGSDATAGTAGSGGAGGSSGAGTGGGENEAGAGTSGTGGSSGGTGGSTSDASDAPADTTAPTVLSVTPADGARGVAKDATIIVVFSERMDPTVTQAAYSSADLPLAGVDFTWSADGTTLTIDPRSDLTYADDTAPSTQPAKSYAFSIAATAVDAAGNALGVPFAASFSTLRRVAHELPGNGWIVQEESNGMTGVGACEGANMLIGALAGTWLAGLVEFDLSLLPADLHSFESAQIQAQQVEVSGAPYGPDNFGTIVGDHTKFDPVTTATPEGARLRRMGTLSSTPEKGPRSLNVLVAVQEDHEKRVERAYRSQYRFSFTNKNPAALGSLTWAVLACPSGEPTLSLVYLAP